MRYVCYVIDVNGRGTSGDKPHETIGTSGDKPHETIVKRTFARDPSRLALLR